jgi:hypothetical protein
MESLMQTSEMYDRYDASSTTFQHRHTMAAPAKVGVASPLPIVTDGFWKGFLFALPLTLVLWLLIFWGFSRLF